MSCLGTEPMLLNLLIHGTMLPVPLRAPPTWQRSNIIILVCTHVTARVCYYTKLASSAARKAMQLRYRVTDLSPPYNARTLFLLSVFGEKGAVDQRQQKQRRRLNDFVLDKRGDSCPY